MSVTINVLFLAAEADPYVKVGGLGDVAGSLPLALRALPSSTTKGIKIDIRLALPLHASIRAESATLHPVAQFSVFRRGGSLPAQVYEINRSGLPIYFISGEAFSVAQSVYSLDPAVDREKYSFFSLAALEMVRSLGWHPHIIHANDWHTALALYAIRSRRSDSYFTRLKTIITLHNLPYTGGDGSDVLAAYGLMPLSSDALPGWARTQPLPLGLWAADSIIPVSPTYAHEILTPEFGCGLEGFLRERADSITGILNALDYTLWNPETDSAIAAPYNAETLEMRLENKIALQQQLDLPADARLPLFAMVSRLDMQKGIDLAFDALRQLPEKSWQAVLLGTGDPLLETAARQLQADFPNRVRAVIRYDGGLSRKVYAGADMLLMPSRYEPCGLSQMIAMRYGCVPIVRATGGLKDTVQEGKNGFLFDEATSEALAEAMRRALFTYAHPVKWQRFQRDGMAQVFSWPRSARQYFNVYRSLTSDVNP